MNNVRNSPTPMKFNGSSYRPVNRANAAAPDWRTKVTTDQTDSPASSAMLAYQAISTGFGAVRKSPDSGKSGLTAATAQARKGSEKKTSDVPCTNFIQWFSCSR